MGITCSRPVADEDSAFEHRRQTIEESREVPKFIKKLYLGGHLRDADLFSFGGSYHGVKHRDKPAWRKTLRGICHLVHDRFRARTTPPVSGWTSAASRSPSAIEAPKTSAANLTSLSNHLELEEFSPDLKEEPVQIPDLKNFGDARGLQIRDQADNTDNIQGRFDGRAVIAAARPKILPEKVHQVTPKKVPEAPKKATTQKRQLQIKKNLTIRRVVDNDFKIPDKARRRHLHSGPGELTEQAAIKISEQRKDLLHSKENPANTVFENPKWFQLCRTNNLEMAISIDKVRTYHCVYNSTTGRWSATYQGTFHANFTQKGNHFPGYVYNDVKFPESKDDDDDKESITYHLHQQRQPRQQQLRHQQQQQQTAQISSGSSRAPWSSG